MESEAIIWGIGISLFGILMVGQGLYLLLGPVDVWYIIRSPYLNLTRYAVIPGGCFFILLGIATFLSERGAGIAIFFGFFVGVIGTIAFGKIPQLKPKWLQWMYNEHGEILDILRAEILSEGDWNKRVRTQEELEIWVNQIREKYGL